GRALHSAETGMLAALALVASPIFLFYLMVPMSDVPVTAWWLAAVVLALKPEARWRLVMSGVVTALALMTRPNLVLLLAPVAVLVSYVWYVPFNNWTFLRFLLPALPMLLVMSAMVLVTFVRRYNLPNGVVLAVALLLVCVGLWRGRETFSLAGGESRYRAAVDV